MGKIILENMEFHARHGVLHHEKSIGNTFLVNLEMEVDITKAGLSDRLEDTLNYQEVYDFIKQTMEVPSELLEHLCQNMAVKLMLKFEPIQHLKLKISKLNPPLGGKVGSVSVETEKSR
jgi:dihydroneopterin aldolase